jgi:hypothetical protein
MMMSLYICQRRNISNICPGFCDFLIAIEPLSLMVFFLEQGALLTQFYGALGRDGW